LLATNIPMALYMSLVHQVSFSVFTKYWDYLFLLLFVLPISVKSRQKCLLYFFFQQRGPEEKLLKGMWKVSYS
jgi:hypothetical protein